MADEQDDSATGCSIVMLWICIILIGVANSCQNSRISELRDRVKALESPPDSASGP